MAALHATASYRNAARTINAHLAQTLSPLVPDGDEKFNSDGLASWFRTSIRPMSEVFSGRVTDSGTTRKAAVGSVLVQVDCFARGAASSPASRLDDVLEMAERAAHALRCADLPLKDFVTDSTGATTTPAALRFTVPTVMHADPTGGWQRRIVQAEGQWVLRHAE